MRAPERRDYGEVGLVPRLRDALVPLNPTLPADTLEDSFCKHTRPVGADLLPPTARCTGYWSTQ